MHPVPTADKARAVQHYQALAAEAAALPAAPGVRHSFSPVTGAYWSAICTATMQRDRGTWRVLIDLPHVAHGRQYPVLSAHAVLDDHGTLVLVADADGAVVLP